MLDVYTYRAIEKIRIKDTSCVDRLFLMYPYEKYCEKYFWGLCRKYKLYKYNYAYQECYDACQLAYIYSLHRCSVSSKSIYDNYVEAYIKKLMKIYFIAAVTVYDDTKNICKENNFFRIATDSYRV